MEDEILYMTAKPGAQLELPLGESRCARFDRAIKTITKERGADYGHPLDNFNIAAQINDALKACPDPVIRAPLMMIGQKLARLCQTPDHVDSIIDVAGYARTIAMVLDERDRRDADDK